MIIHNVEQRSDEWKRLRLAKVTGTRVKDAIGANNLKLIDTLIAEKVSQEIEDEPFLSLPMMRGLDYEPVARKDYEKKKDRNVTQVGFITSEKYPWLGYSPDGLILGKEVRGLEIKCPNTNAHVRYIRMNCIPNEYKYQIYTAFIVCPDMKELDFVSWDSRFNLKPLHIITITRESIATELKETEAGLVKFWAKYEKYYNQVTF